MQKGSLNIVSRGNSYTEKTAFDEAEQENLLPLGMSISPVPNVRNNIFSQDQNVLQSDSSANVLKQKNDKDLICSNIDKDFSCPSLVAHDGLLERTTLKQIASSELNDSQIDKELHEEISLLNGGKESSCANVDDSNEAKGEMDVQENKDLVSYSSSVISLPLPSVMNSLDGDGNHMTAVPHDPGQFHLPSKDAEDQVCLPSKAKENQALLSKDTENQDCLPSKAKTDQALPSVDTEDHDCLPTRGKIDQDLLPSKNTEDQDSLHSKANKDQDLIPSNDEEDSDLQTSKDEEQQNIVYSENEEDQDHAPSKDVGEISSKVHKECEKETRKKMGLLLESGINLYKSHLSWFNDLECSSTVPVKTYELFVKVVRLESCVAVVFNKIKCSERDGVTMSKLCETIASNSINVDVSDLDRLLVHSPLYCKRFGVQGFVWQKCIKEQLEDCHWQGILYLRKIWIDHSISSKIDRCKLVQFFLLESPEESANEITNKVCKSLHIPNCFNIFQMVKETFGHSSAENIPKGNQLIKSTNDKEHSPNHVPLSVKELSQNPVPSSSEAQKIFGIAKNSGAVSKRKPSLVRREFNVVKGTTVRDPPRKFSKPAILQKLCPKPTISETAKPQILSPKPLVSENSRQQVLPPRPTISETASPQISSQKIKIPEIVTPVVGVPASSLTMAPILSTGSTLTPEKPNLHSAFGNKEGIKECAGDESALDVNSFIKEIMSDVHKQPTKKFDGKQKQVSQECSALKVVTQVSDTLKRAAPECNVQNGVNQANDCNKKEAIQELNDALNGFVQEVPQQSINSSCVKEKVVKAKTEKGATPKCDVQKGVTQVCDSQKGVIQECDAKKGITPELDDALQGIVQDLLQQNNNSSNAEEKGIATKTNKGKNSSRSSPKRKGTSKGSVKRSVPPIRICRSPSQGGKLTCKKSVDQYLLPMKLGWVRELVKRGTSTSARADIYYHPPLDKKLRSLVEVGKYLLAKEETRLSTANFTFSKEPLGIGPPMELVRDALPSKRKFNDTVNVVASTSDAGTSAEKERPRKRSKTHPASGNFIPGRYFSNSTAVTDEAKTKKLKTAQLDESWDDDVDITNEVGETTGYEGWITGNPKTSTPVKTNYKDTEEITLKNENIVEDDVLPSGNEKEDSDEGKWFDILQKYGNRVLQRKRAVKPIIIHELKYKHLVTRLYQEKAPDLKLPENPGSYSATLEKSDQVSSSGKGRIRIKSLAELNSSANISGNSNFSSGSSHNINVQPACSTSHVEGNPLLPLPPYPGNPIAFPNPTANNPQTIKVLVPKTFTRPPVSTATANIPQRARVYVPKHFKMPNVRTAIPGTTQAVLIQQPLNSVSHSSFAQTQNVNRMKVSDLWVPPVQEDAYQLPPAQQGICQIEGTISQVTVHQHHALPGLQSSMAPTQQGICQIQGTNSRVPELQQPIPSVSQSSVPPAQQDIHPGQGTHSQSSISLAQQGIYPGQILQSQGPVFSQSVPLGVPSSVSSAQHGICESQVNDSQLPPRTFAGQEAGNSNRQIVVRNDANLPGFGFYKERN